MKIIEQFPNFQSIIESYLIDDNYSIPLSTSSKLSYMRLLPIRNKGCTHYELDTIKGKGVIFTVITVKGFKTIREDSSYIITEDLSKKEWIILLGKLTDEHMESEEYQAFLRGYTKSKSGCLGLLIILISLLWKL